MSRISQIFVTVFFIKVAAIAHAAVPMILTMGDFLKRVFSGVILTLILSQSANAQLLQGDLGGATQVNFYERVWKNLSASASPYSHNHIFYFDSTSTAQIQVYWFPQGSEQQISFFSSSNLTTPILSLPSATGRYDVTVPAGRNYVQIQSPSYVTYGNDVYQFILSGLSILSTTNMVFDSQASGGESAPLEVQIQNNGNASMSPNFVVSGDFARKGGSCGQTIPADSQCSVALVFKATTTGARTGQLKIYTDPTNNTYKTVSLSGAGTAPIQFVPIISLSTTQINFGNQAVGTVGSPVSMTISNIGNADITDLSLSLASEYVYNNGTSGCANLLRAGENCVVQVKFAPTATGTRLGSLQVISSAPGSPQSIQFTGTGLPPQNQLPMAPTLVSATPLNATAGQAFTVSVRVGTDPDASDTVGVKCSSPNSNASVSNPYSSLLGAQGRVETVTLNFSSTGSNPLYCYTFDNNGGNSTTSQLGAITVVAAPNHAPNAPTIGALPSVIYVNERTPLINVTTGADSDGDDTKILCTADNSDRTLASPYDSGLGAGVRTVQTSFLFNSTGSAKISCKTQDAKWLDSIASEITVNVVVRQTAPVVSTVLPSTAQLNQLTTFTVSGANLIDGMAYWIDGCAGGSNGTVGAGSSTSRTFQCTPQSSGTKSGLVKNSANGTTLLSFTVNVTQQQLAPNAPSTPSVTATGSNSLNISWNSVSGAMLYSLWRSTSNNSASASQIQCITPTSYSDSGNQLSPSTTYYYWVKAASSSDGALCSPPCQTSCRLKNLTLR